MNACVTFGKGLDVSVTINLSEAADAYNLPASVSVERLTDGQIAEFARYILGEWLLVPPPGIKINTIEEDFLEVER